MTPAAIVKRKRQAILAGFLFVAVIGLAVWDFHGWVGTPAQSIPVHMEATKLQRGPGRKAAATALPSSFHLQLERLLRSEGTDYGDGRDLFGGNPAPVAIEAPIAPARPSPVEAPAARPIKALPQIDIKYAGFAESGSGNINGLFMRGDDISIAHAGEIIFHRFRVGSIQPTSAQLIDLVSNQTQPVAVGSAK